MDECNNEKKEHLSKGKNEGTEGKDERTKESEIKETA